MRIEEERYWFQWIFPVKLVQRAVERLLHSRPANPRIPIRPINEALYFFSRAELALAGKVPFPFGSSLYVLGRKAG
jgi:hypothetical protein